MLCKGLQATINSHNPGMYGYEGVTLDYLYAFLSWDLDLKDLKQLSLNGIKYSSIDRETAQHLEKDVFERQWKKFIAIVLEKFA